jgi:hypothetical protein
MWPVKSSGWNFGDYLIKGALIWGFQIGFVAGNSTI